MSLKFVAAVFVCSIILSHTTTEYLPSIYHFCNCLYQDYKYDIFQNGLCKLHFSPSNLHLHFYNICFVNIFDSFISVIMLKTLKFKSSVIFGTHTLLNRSSGALQLPTDLSKLPQIDNTVILHSIH